MFDWDTTGLPLPTANFANKVTSSVIRTKMDSGRTRQRRRFTSGVRAVDVTFRFTDAEYALFQGVYKYKLSSGADWFTISLPLGDDFKDYTARFTGDTYQTNYVPVMNWDVKASMEVEDDSPLTEEEVDDALGL